MAIPAQKPVFQSHMLVSLLVVAAVACGSFNEVASKIKSVPLKRYNYLAALLNALVYFIVWSVVAIVRLKMGFTSMTSVRYVFSPSGAWRFLAVSGLADTAAQVLLFIGQPHVSMPMFALARQGNLIFTATFSVLILGTRYIALEILAVGLVFGAVIILIHGSSNEKDTNVGFLILVAIGPAGHAISNTLKEKVFRDYQRKRDISFASVNEVAESTPATTMTPLQVDSNGCQHASQNPPEKLPEKLDTFVVMACVNVFSFLFALPMVPVNVLLKQTGGKTLSEFFADGLTCFFNSVPARDAGASGGEACTFAWESWVAYIIINLMFNFLMMSTMKYGSALLSSVAAKVVAPMALLLGMIEWHFGPISLPASPVGVLGWLSLTLVLLGLYLFRKGNNIRDSLPAEKKKCCWPVCS